MTTDINSVILSLNLDMQQAATAHFRSEGNTQPASGACAIALPASAPARIVAENSVRSIFSPS